MDNFIKIYNKKYKIIDALEYITLADSFVKNKIGKGHGEAKLYVGNENQKTLDFFGDIKNLKSFFLKTDFEKFLQDAEEEYLNPQQDYIKKDKMVLKLEKLKKDLKEMTEKEILEFVINRVDVAPPRIYVNSESIFYDFMREIALPNISYLSVLKIKDKKEKIYYYFKIFIDYRSDIIGYKTLEETRQEEKIKELSISDKQKEKMLSARIGQGAYREKLLEECPFCPFTLVNDERLLIASHIKPWTKSDEKEKVDPKNGFMFTPTYDKLFDRGFISFENNKTLKVSPWLSPMNQKRLGIHDGKLIEKLNLDDKRKKYLQYHREYIFKG